MNLNENLPIDNVWFWLIDFLNYKIFFNQPRKFYYNFNVIMILYKYNIKKPINLTLNLKNIRFVSLNNWNILIGTLILFFLILKILVCSAKLLKANETNLVTQKNNILSHFQCFNIYIIFITLLIVLCTNYYFKFKFS